jgi:broad specificity phosphatase PhoE
VSSFSQHYPGNDSRYVKYLSDARFSVRESVIRTIEQGKIVLHRKLPKHESLKDCMDRTIPFFTERITPEAIEPGRRVLISSSENAIRGLLMHLCEIPEEKITDLEIPNGLPLVFDLESKCLKLLDDGTGRDPLKVHNFGNAANYLFRPCVKENGNLDEECGISYSAPAVLSLEDQAAIDAIKRVPVQATTLANE